MYAHFVLCVYWGLGVGVENLHPTPQRKKGQEVYALRFVRTSSYATASGIAFLKSILHLDFIARLLHFLVHVPIDEKTALRNNQNLQACLYYNTGKLPL